MAANNPNEPAEESCSICGFMDPNFEDDEELYINYNPREFRGTAEGSGSSLMNTFDHTGRQDGGLPPGYSYFNVENVGPEWLRDELKRLFPEARNPAPPFLSSDPGSSSRAPNDSAKLPVPTHFLPNQYHNVSNWIGQEDPISQQKPQELAAFMLSELQAAFMPLEPQAACMPLEPQAAFMPLEPQAAFMPLEPQAASVMVQNNNCAMPQYTHFLPIQNTTSFVYPYTKSEIPGQTPSSNIQKYSSNRTSPNTSYSELLSHTAVDTKEMSSSKKACKVTAAGSHSLVPSTTCASRITNVENELNQAKPFTNKIQKEKESPTHSDASEITAHNARSRAHTKVADIEPRASGSKDLASSALPSHAKGGGQRCSLCAKNGEPEAVVTSHTLYNSETKVVSCPILRAYRCEACSATGDYAHTRSYCPRIRMLEGNVQSTTIALKSTRRQANGMERNTKPVRK